MKQGDVGYYFFVLSKGNLDVEIDGVKKKTLSRGSMLGELALLYNQARTASILATDDCQLWCLDREDFIKGIKKIVLGQANFIRPTLDKIPAFGNDERFYTNPLIDYLSSSQKDDLATVTIQEKCKKGHVIVTEGEEATCLYVIQDGRVRISSMGEDLRDMKTGEYFGEAALFVNTKRRATVTALTQVCIQ